MTAEQFKAALKGLGLTQTQFSLLLQRHSSGTVHLNTISRWCCGKCPVPAGIGLSIALLQGVAEMGRLAAIINEGDGEP